MSQSTDQTPDRTPFAMHWSDLATWRGRLGGPAYLVWGLALFGLKFALDRQVAAAFGRSWDLLDYLAPGQAFGSLLYEGEDRAFFGLMWFLALPFITLGLSLTLKRLRGAGLSPWLLLLFFIPVANLLFFLILAAVPSRRPAALAASDPLVLGPADRPHEPPPAARPTATGTLAATNAPARAPAPGTPVRLGYGSQPAPPGWFARLIPREAGAGLAVAILLPVPFFLGLTVLSVVVLRSYGWAVFVGLPFAHGMTAALLYGVREERSLRECSAAGIFSILVAGAGVLVVAIEGAGCLLMLMPLVLPVAWLGAAFGYAIQAAYHARRPYSGAYSGANSNRPRADWRGRPLAIALLFVPAHMIAERFARPPAPVFAVTTAVEVDAPPTTVWRHVVQFGQLPPPTELLFRAGIAYPVRAEITGRGVGAVRRCVFSTGAFVEPIVAWEEGRLLKFSVTESPPPMKEWTFHADIHPPHLENFLVSQGGQFRLIPLPGGRTRLEGTTWYQHHMWPAGYWRAWSDSIIATIHRRVLDHVKRLSEADPDGDNASDPAIDLAAIRTGGEGNAP